MGIPRSVLKADEPRRTGLKLRPSLNQQLTALAMLDGKLTSDLLNVAVAEYLLRRQSEPGRKASRQKARSLSA